MGDTHNWDCQKSQLNCIPYLQIFTEISIDVCTKIYKTYVRPLLEHAMVVWNPYFQKDIDFLKRAQRRFTKLPTTLKNTPYEDRLTILGLTTLKDRR